MPGIQTSSQQQMVEAALRALCSAASQLRMYPPGSPVVQQALQRSISSLSNLLAKGPVMIDVLPQSFRIMDEEYGKGMPLIENLAGDLHGHSVAALLLNNDLDQQSLQRLIELAVSDRDSVTSSGGFVQVVQSEGLQGIRAERIPLERLFNEGDPDADRGEDHWQFLLKEFRASREGDTGSGMEWETLVGDHEQIREFLLWLMEEAPSISQVQCGSRSELLRDASRQLAEEALKISPDHLNLLAMAVRDMAEEIGRDALLELLADPLVVSQPLARAEVSEGDAAAHEPPTYLGEDAGTVDITRTIARELVPAHAEELIIHALRSQQKSSIRLYGLFSKLLEGHPHREEVSDRVGANLQQDARFDTVLKAWPRLIDVFQEKAPDRFVSPGLDSTIRHLFLRQQEEGVWPIDRIKLRLIEMSPPAVLTRKVQILLAILERETADPHYEKITGTIRRALPQLLPSGDYDAIHEILRVLCDHRTEEAGRTERQKAAAESVLAEFLTEANVRHLMHESLAGSSVQAEVIDRIFLLDAPTMVPAMLNVLAREESARIRIRVVKTLIDMGDRVLPAVREILERAEWYLTRNLVIIIGKIGNPESMRHLSQTIHHADVRVRMETVRTLIKSKNFEIASGILAEALNDADLQVRLLAIEGLGESGDVDAVDKLLLLLRLPNWRGQNSSTIQSASIALARLSDTRALPDLTRLAKKPWVFARRREPVRKTAQWAVRSLQGEDSGPPPMVSGTGPVGPGYDSTVTALANDQED